MSSEGFTTAVRRDNNSSDDGRISVHNLQRATLVPSKRLEDTNYLIPSPGYNGTPPEKYDPLLMRLPIIIGAPMMLFLLGLGLEILVNLSNKYQGFPVPLSSRFGLFGSVSSQFLASFLPTFLIIPNAIIWRELDWMIRMYQPYLVLLKGNAPAETSILLDYVELGPVLTVPRALKYKHRLVFISSLTAVLTYFFQPFTSSVFQIRQIQYSFPYTATNLDVIARAPGVENLEAFVAAAGYTDASVVHELPDPKFVSGGWATSRLTFYTKPDLNATLTLLTTGIRSLVNCSNPATKSLTQGASSTFTLAATSTSGCSRSVTFNPDVSTVQYGVEAVPSCPSSNGVVETQVEFMPVMFWFFHRRSDNGQPEAQPIFCTPYLTGNIVTTVSDAKTGELLRVDDRSKGIPENDVLNGPQGGRTHNGVAFTPSSNPFIQVRANATNSLVPAAIFRNMTNYGLDTMFDRPNGVLDSVQRAYTRHLSISAKEIYFVPGNSTLDGTMDAWQPRLVVDPLPAHTLAIILLLTGIVGIWIHILHRKERLKLRLAAMPITIGSTVALTARSGFGHLLTPYDGELTMEQKLEGLRFGFDERTGAISATGEPSHDDRNPLIIDPDTRTSLLKATTPPPTATFPHIHEK